MAPPLSSPRAGEDEGGGAGFAALCSMWLISLCAIRAFCMTETNAKTPATLEIRSLSYGPYGIGRIGGKALMIPHTAPGDTVEAEIVESKERYAIGEMVRLIAPSPVRQKPRCPYVGACGGCSWQHLRYDAQLDAKQQSVADALHRIGKLDGFELRPIIPASNEYHYRRRIRLQVEPSKRIGFYAASSHELVEIDSCAIADDRLQDVIEPLRRWLDKLETSFQYLEIVSGDELNQLVVVGKVTDDFILRDEAMCENLVGEDGKLQGLIVTGHNLRKVWGEPT